MSLSFLLRKSFACQTVFRKGIHFLVCALPYLPHPDLLICNNCFTGRRVISLQALPIFAFLGCCVCTHSPVNLLHHAFWLPTHPHYLLEAKLQTYFIVGREEKVTALDRDLYNCLLLLSIYSDFFILKCELSQGNWDKPPWTLFDPLENHGVWKRKPPQRFKPIWQARRKWKWFVNAKTSTVGGRYQGIQQRSLEGWSLSSWTFQRRTQIAY